MKGIVSILFLLVLGSVKRRKGGLKISLRSLNPILAGTGFCLKFRDGEQPVELPSQSYSCWYWVLSEKICNFCCQRNRSQSYSCWYWVLSKTETKQVSAIEVSI